MRSVIEYLRGVGSPGPGCLPDRELLERFLARRDEAAFAALLRRHGPMVLSVCRRVLGNVHDAEEAFQAVWMVLARKAAAVRRRELLASWLHGVAYRAAREARRATVRRHARERLAARPEAVSPDSPADLREVLDVELSRLPEKYRIAVVLCDLEGASYREAARRLGWPEGTLAGRLSRARALLAARLARRGLPLSTAGLALALASPADGRVSAALATSAIRASTLSAAGQATPQAVSVTAFSLMQGVLRTMWLTKLKVVVGVGLVVAGVGLGMALVPVPAAADRPAAVVVDRSAPPNAGQAKQVPRKGAPQPKGTRKVEEALAASISVDFRNVPLGEALDYLQDRMGVNMVIDRVALQQPITLRLQRVAARVAWDHVLRQAGLSYHIEDGVLVVTAVESRLGLVRRIYPVDDLVGASGKAENLIEVITRTVGPTTWSHEGGLGTIAYFAEGRVLIVNQSAAVQEELSRLLIELRAVQRERGGRRER
jgi:RNA polymerase sigma factor (sigma-70 family)